MTYGPNQNGRNTVTGALRVATGVPTLPAAAVSTATDGPLPF